MPAWPTTPPVYMLIDVDVTFVAPVPVPVPAGGTFAGGPEVVGKGATGGAGTDTDGRAERSEVVAGSAGLDGALAGADVAGTGAVLKSAGTEMPFARAHSSTLSPSGQQ